MTKLFDELFNEMEQESAATRRVLEAVPGDKLEWRPHGKSMTLGQLARHVSTIPGNIAELISVETFERPPNFNPQPESVESSAELIPGLESSMAKAREVLGGMDDSTATGTWKFVAEGKVLLEAPRVALFRSLGLNHWYHHRAQLGVYLRLLDVPVPTVYGRTADDDPFGAMVEEAGGK